MPTCFALGGHSPPYPLAAAGLRGKAQELLDIVRENPYQTAPSHEKLIGDLAGAISRRINIQHHLVYQVLEEQKQDLLRRRSGSLTGGHANKTDASSGVPQSSV